MQDWRIANLLPQLWAAQTLQIFLGRREKQREPACEWLTLVVLRPPHLKGQPLAKLIANTTSPSIPSLQEMVTE